LSGVFQSSDGRADQLSHGCEHFFAGILTDKGTPARRTSVAVNLAGDRSAAGSYTQADRRVPAAVALALYRDFRDSPPADGEGSFGCCRHDGVIGRTLQSALDFVAVHGGNTDLAAGLQLLERFPRCGALRQERGRGRYHQKGHGRMRTQTDKSFIREHRRPSVANNS
jgi:hypothetical protein